MICRPIFLAVLVLAVASPLVGAQTPPLERTIQAPKAEVEKALQTIPTGGRLPILDGFVDSTQPLDEYQRGYYQYSIGVSAIGSASCVVRASAKITAWYQSKSTGDSGYRVLNSNGRLESDLLDQLEDRFKNTSAANSSPKAATPRAAAEPNSASPSSAVPDAPRPAVSSAAHSNVLGLSHPTASAPMAENANGGENKRLQQLRDEASNLEQILQNQAHPTDLAIVKQPHTPIYARPFDGSKVVMEADAEDEFHILESESAWVHVQISGLSRGWIRRSSVELPTEVAAKIPAAADNPENPPKEGFRQTREETSLFPGKWQPLDGKTVRIIWVQPFENKGFGENSKLVFAKSVFRHEYPELSKQAPTVAGIVVVFDSADGGMAAATFAALQQWRAGHLSEDAFWKQCWLDPADAFRTKE